MKQIITKISLCVLVVTGLNACTLFKKTISEKVVVAIQDTSFVATINSTALNSKYTNTITSQQIMTAFLKGFQMEGKNTANVVLEFNTVNADFILAFKYLKVEETSKSQTITDPKSPYNGQNVILNTVEVSVDFEISETKNPSAKLLNCSNSKQRSESETNNRDIGDLISGANKDNSQYRTKLLDANIGLNLSEDVGRRIWVPISRRISKEVKK